MNCEYQLFGCIYGAFMSCNISYSYSYSSPSPTREIMCFSLFFSSFQLLHVLSLLVMNKCCATSQCCLFRRKPALRNSLISPDICLFMKSVENDRRVDQCSHPGILIVDTESFHKKLLQFIVLGNGFSE